MLYKLLFWKKRDFGKSLSKTKAVFNKAIRKAEKLIERIDEEGQKNDSKILELQERNNVLSEVRRDTSKFLNSLSKLVN